MRKQIAALLSGLFLIILVGLFLVADNIDELPKIQLPSNAGSNNEVPNATTVKVLRVVDGDTVKVNLNGEEETVRVIGINTPETVDPRKPVECFGQEASAEAHKLLDDTWVRLTPDASQGKVDRYDRLLRYVTLADGRDFGQVMISQGYGYEYTYDTPYQHQTLYQQAQVEAQEAERGLWAEGECE